MANLSIEAWRTKGGHRVGQRCKHQEDQQDNCKHQEDKRRAQGQRTTAGKLQAPEGQEKDETRTQHSGAQPLWPAIFFLRENPTVNCLEKWLSG